MSATQPFRGSKISMSRRREKEVNIDRIEKRKEIYSFIRQNEIKYVDKLLIQIIDCKKTQADIYT